MARATGTPPSAAAPSTTRATVARGPGSPPRSPAASSALPHRRRAGRVPALGHAVGLGRLLEQRGRVVRHPRPIEGGERHPGARRARSATAGVTDRCAAIAGTPVTTATTATATSGGHRHDDGGAQEEGPAVGGQAGARHRVQARPQEPGHGDSRRWVNNATGEPVSRQLQGEGQSRNAVTESDRRRSSVADHSATLPSTVASPVTTGVAPATSTETSIVSTVAKGWTGTSSW
jgi:hypothetical protein